MLMVISPAKKLDFESRPVTLKYTQPELLEHSRILVDLLKQKSIEDLIKILNISYGLAETNLQRFQQWNPPFSLDNAKQAILAFNGDVYEGLNAKNFSEGDFDFAQKHLRILSGLYGVLRPLDLIQPYRLPMGTKLVNPRGKNLYQFWGDIITDTLNQTIRQNKYKYLINLASNEYFKAINPEKLEAKIITPVFKENKNGQYRVVSFYAKKARGLMARFAIKNRLQDPEQLKKFNEAGYRFAPEQSSDDKLVFVR
jgi:cytoplasmic iron level regulating protein YaaA (DUF328/UPF0246 family)